MIPKRIERLKSRGLRVATRRAIQDDFLMRLARSEFSFIPGDKEPWGIQSQVTNAVNGMRYGDETMKVTKETVSKWCDKVRRNDYQPSALLSDYTTSSQNARKLTDDEQRQVRKKVLEEKLNCNEVVNIYSESKQREILISQSTVRRALKRKFPDEPSMVAAVPKPMKIGGGSAHHNRCRLIEAEYWNAKSQAFINRMWFADEKKITFREHKNRSIDIEWCMRGTAGITGWYECPRWPGQVNLLSLTG